MIFAETRLIDSSAYNVRIHMHALLLLFFDKNQTN